MSPLRFLLLLEAVLLLAAGVAAAIGLFLRFLAFQPAADDAKILAKLRQAGFTRSQRRITALLTFRGSAFRHRTVRKLEFMSPDLVHFRMSLDYSMPGHPACNSGASEPHFVPVVLVHKRKLSRVDLRDEDGGAVPIVNRDVEQCLVTHLLSLLWADHFPDVSEGLTPSAVASMYRMVEASPEISIQHYRLMCAALPRVSDARKLRDFLRVASRFVRSAQLFALVESHDAPTRRILKVAFLDDAPWRYSNVSGATTAFVNRLVGAPLASLAERVVAKTNPSLQSQMEEQAAGKARAAELGAPFGSEPPSRPFRNLCLDLKGLARGLLSRAGLMSRPYGGEFSAFHSQSEHLEVGAPPGTMFSGGHLKRVAADSSETPVMTLDTVRRGALVAHLYCSHNGTVNEGPGIREFEVRLRARPRGWLLHVLTSLGLCAILLAAAWAKRADLVTGGSSNLVAIALGIGAVAVVYLARPNEHAMATRLLEGPRLALVATALATLGQISLLALSPGQLDDASSVAGPTFAEDGWIAVVVATCAVAVVALNYVGWVAGAIVSLLRKDDR